MRLSELAHGYTIRPAASPRDGDDPEISGITEDSRTVETGMLFVAVRGTAHDGAKFVAHAVQRGAAAVAAERLAESVDVPLVEVPSGRAALADLADRFFEHPSRELKIIGFTGTFGKTSTSEVLRELLQSGGARPGVLGSLGARYGNFHDPGRGLTTPAPVELQRALRGLRTAGADTVIMEVTSHALRLERVAGMRFRGGLLAAIMPGEHTDFHRSYEDYIEAKRLFLDYLAADALLAYDADNHASRRLAADARVARRSGFSLSGRAADVVLKNVALDRTGARFSIAGRRLHSPLLGRGHLKNVALALAYALADGISIDAARRVLRTLRPLPRRMERYDVGGRMVLDDTAGHPDSLRATFDVAAMLTRAPGVDASRTVVVYAIRGNRGADINRRNALALADLAAEHGMAPMIVTASADVAGPHDRTSAAEIDATRQAFAERGMQIQFFDELSAAAAAALTMTGPGDLIVLVGAQGMNGGKHALGSAP